jgi:hypothetical protein
VAKKIIRSKTPPLKNMKHYTKAGESVKMVTDKEMTEAKKNRLKSWVTFYRKNPSYFVEHYMGVTLFPYQRFWINLMAHSTEFVAIASRASAKSWLIAVYAIARCILYPGTTVALASSTKAQAGLIISEKAKSLSDEYPNINREVSNIVTNQNKWEMTFYNGSKINVVVSGESGRGHRSNVTVLEERRLIPNEVINAIIRPFLIARQPPYLKKKEYSDIPELKEEPQEIIITSAHYKSAEWYPETKRFLRQIVAGDESVKAVFFDYLISIKHGIKTKKQMKQEINNFDSISFLMEYGNIPYGSSANSFYKMGLFNRTIKRGWRPITDEAFISGHKNPYDIPKMSDEVRVISVDVAMRAGKTNDNTIITCARLMPTRKGWLTEISYIESHNGARTDTQALRIKQIFTEFEADYLVLDIANAGISVFDELSKLTKDEERGLEYPAYTIMLPPYVDQKQYDELSERTLGQDSIPCIFPIHASGNLNALIAVKFKERLRNKLVSFLVDDNTEEEFLIKSGNKDILDQFDTGMRAYLLQANVQTSLMINECLALEMSMVNGILKLEEPPGARKDRYTSVSYLNYFVSLLDIDLLKERSSGDEDEKEFLGVSQIYRGGF